jgi:hypothetical protein
MRTVIISFTVLFFTGFSVKGQQYIPFPVDSAYWSFRLVEDQISHKKVTYVQLMVQGRDTVINNKVYQQIIRRQHEEMVPAGSPVPSGIFVADAPDAYFAGMCEDSKKVFFYRLSGESLYYDFNLNLADTLPPAYWLHSYVTSIDSMLVGNDYHKVFHTSLTSPVHNDIIVEGIGGIDGLFRIGMPFLCFRYGNKTFLHSSTSPCNYLLPFGTANGIPQPDKAPLVISPNPFTDRISITGAEGKRYRLTTLTGQVLAEAAVTSNAIDLQQLPSGLYIIYITGQAGDAELVQRLVKW